MTFVPVQKTSGDLLYFPTVKLESLSGRPLVKGTRVRLRYANILHRTERHRAEWKYIVHTFPQVN